MSNMHTYAFDGSLTGFRGSITYSLYYSGFAWCFKESGGRDPQKEYVELNRIHKPTLSLFLI